MRYLVLATDYDGTLASDGRVDEATLAALQRLRDSGRKLTISRKSPPSRRAGYIEFLGEYPQCLRLRS